LATKGNTVYFLNPPSVNVTGVVCKKVAERLFILDYKDPYKGLRFLPKLLRKALTKRLYKKLEISARTDFDVVILFENSRFYDLDFLPSDVLSIYFQVDEDQNFHPGKAAKTADLVIAINHIIQDILSVFRKPVHRIPHAFSGSFTQKALNILNGVEQYKKAEGRIKAYFIGNLDSHFIEVDLFAKLVSEKKDIDFVFIGPYSQQGKLYNSIKNQENVYLHGKVPASEIPQLLDEADVLLLAYREEFVSSSHKLMEYLASGKAIVAIKALGYPEDPDLFYCSGTAENFIDLFSKVCADIEEANSPDKMKKRIQFARDNTYEIRVKQLEELIQSSQ
ncbi:MAG: hypothetical protein C4330_14115, partial [Chitinophagaceae bacterium]